MTPNQAPQTFGPQPSDEASSEFSPDLSAESSIESSTAASTDSAPALESAFSISTKTRKAPRRLALGLATAGLLALVASGCGSCAKVSEKGSEHFISPDSPGFAYVPSGGGLAKKSQALLDTVRGIPGGGRFVKVAADISRQLGFDPLSPTGLSEAGIDLSRSWAFALGAGEVTVQENGEEKVIDEGMGAFVVLPFKDRKVLEATLLRVSEGRLGELARSTAEHDGVKLVVHTPKDNPELAGVQVVWAEESGNLVVATGETPQQLVSAVVNRVRKNRPSVASTNGISKLQSRLGAREIYLYAGRAPEAAGFWSALLPEGISVGLGVNAKEMDLRMFLGMEEEVIKPFQQLFVGGGAKELELLPVAAPLVLRGGIDLSAVAASLEASQFGSAALSAAREVFAKAEIDLDDELINNFEPGFALSVSLSPTANLSRAFDFNIRRSNPFASYALRAVGKVKDREKAAGLLEKIAKSGSAIGVSISSEEEEGFTVYRSRYHLGEGLSWTLAGDNLLVTGGLKDALVPWAQSLSSEKGSAGSNKVLAGYTNKAKASLLADDGIALGSDLAQASKEFDALPVNAFGNGPGAFMARSVAQNVVKPLARLKAVAAFKPEEEGLSLDVSVGIE